MNDPVVAGGKALRMSVYSDDLGMLPPPDATHPRTELSGYKTLLSLETEYVATWDYYLSQYSTD